jgi:hypothetical protein
MGERADNRRLCLSSGIARRPSSALAVANLFFNAYFELS